MFIFISNICHVIKSLTLSKNVCTKIILSHILKLDGINISQSTVSNVKRKISRQRNFESKIKIFRTKSRLPRSIVNKVIDINNPPTQRATAKFVHIAQSNISNIIKNAGFILRKKRKTQNLTSSNIIKRSHRLYLQLANH